ncbi:T9SS type A sorting domain-containing protein [Chryseobacterium sp.]|uniref:DUF7619 domain-containing protein n=1 Tax=Chryseobacterium sp. TaxID=1871047 RepID=UPI000EE0954E|nr:T9SS type A sorting domain-containing protein [Chryseobacterium sp.]HCA06479.1 T9SS C-terminal target domain-containing protein [Chryseobacterium sp.]
MKKIYFIICMMILSLFQAQTVNIPDANFKQILLADTPYLAQNLNGFYVTIDANHDGEIQLSEAASISKLNFDLNVIPNHSYFFNNLTSMEGIKSFTNLTDIYINSFPSLQTLDLSNSPLLRNVETNMCSLLSSINVQGCSQLYSLDIFMSKISSIDVSGLTNLYDLHITQSLLSNIYLNNNTNLNTLYLPSNKLTTIPLNQTPNLKYLTISGNQFTAFDFSTFSKLEVLNCTYNKFISLDLSHNANLKSFSCDMNPNLQSLFIKNGINNFTQSINSTFSSTPNLAYICADDSEISNVNALLPSTTSCVVNSYCSFTPGGAFYTISGNTKFDSNNNGCDVNDPNKAFQKFNITSGSISGSIMANSSGNYSIPVQAGAHTISPVLENPTYFNISPTSLTANFPAQTSPLTQNFCMTANGNHPDLEVVIIPTDIAVPGFDADYKIVFKNKGTGTQSGNVVFGFNDDLMNFVSATTVPNSQSTGVLNWNFTNLLPFESREIKAKFTLNTSTQTPSLNMGDVLHYTAQINGVADETPADNTFTLNQTVVNSFDPNDKTCLEGASIEQAQVGDYVHYLIRFENNGTANARNIVVKDDIDTSKFDLSTLVPLNGSHRFVTKISGTNTVEFVFENIQLPFDDANNDGYVSFKIKTKSTLTAGNSFSNTARIYFDYNAPIVTNTYTTSVQTVLATSEVNTDKNYFNIYPNPVKDILYIQSKEEIVKAEIYDAAGRILTTTGVKNNAVNVADLAKGNYIIKVSTKNKTLTLKFIKA